MRSLGLGHGKEPLDVEIRVLGPIDAEHEGRKLNLGGPKQRLVLAVLLARVNEVVSTGRIIEEVWLDAPPPSHGIL